jgi:hypothetical protein
MNALTQSAAFWVALAFGLVLVYILPSLIGAIRRVEDLGWLIVINLLPSGVGWLAALIGALMLPSREPSRPFHPAEPHRYEPVYIPSPEARLAVAEIVELMVRADDRRRMREAGHTNPSLDGR